MGHSEGHKEQANYFIFPVRMTRQFSLIPVLVVFGIVGAGAQLGSKQVCWVRRREPWPPGESTSWLEPRGLVPGPFKGSTLITNRLWLGTCTTLALCWSTHLRTQWIVRLLLALRSPAQLSSSNSPGPKPRRSTGNGQPAPGIKYHCKIECVQYSLNYLI